MKSSMTTKTQPIPQTHAGRVIQDLMAMVDAAIARVRQQIQTTHQPVNPSIAQVSKGATQ